MEGPGVSEFRSSHHSDVTFTLARWPYHLAIVLSYVFRMDFQFVVNSQEHDFRVPPPSNLKYIPRIKFYPWHVHFEFVPFPVFLLNICVSHM